ncbi:alpha/beta fold hydrolase [Pseudooceanicola sp. HF7]|uniref:alpha/beta fold hydrolase n=1 Tax=Pseudooceanicola sp. HF7 TaxID=2721560 RepID=UPI0014317C8A|nr:alpha/beta fold hydrolase [Pseudooceanicola sp. HF7]NIZ08483.1 alpha/beta fold hydrolase [Pseudooceanicola sp. HF7]
MSDAPERLILIHGAWAGAWVFDGLIGELAQRGRRAEAPELPGNGHHRIPAQEVSVPDYLLALEQAIMAGPGPVALLGHSGGGMFVSAALSRFPGRISHAIWLAGMLLEEGSSFEAIQERIAGKGQRIGVTPHIIPSDDGRTNSVPVEVAMAHFFQDVPQDVARAAAERLTPQPVAGYRIPAMRPAGFAALPKLYVQCLQDRSVLPEAQRIMCDGVPGLDVVQIDSGHAPQLSCPAELADILDGWLPR